MHKAQNEVLKQQHSSGGLKEQRRGNRERTEVLEILLQLGTGEALLADGDGLLQEADGLGALAHVDVAHLGLHSQPADIGIVEVFLSAVSSMTIESPRQQDMGGMCPDGKAWTAHSISKPRTFQASMIKCGGQSSSAA